jgi:hypothetical protein
VKAGTRYKETFMMVVVFSGGGNSDSFLKTCKMGFSEVPPDVVV